MWFRLKDRDDDGQAFCRLEADMESAAEMTSNDRGSTIEDSLDYLPEARTLFIQILADGQGALLGQEDILRKEFREVSQGLAKATCTSNHPDLIRLRRVGLRVCS
jgi:hypothetical protein